MHAWFLSVYVLEIDTLGLIHFHSAIHRNSIFNALASQMQQLTHSRTHIIHIIHTCSCRRERAYLLVS